MANTTYFGWETPDDTDLVKDGAAAIRTLGQAIDTSMQDLEGGTTGQILSKNSNADMDFVWVTNDVGDITEVVAGTGLSGGGSSGSVTLTNTVATEFDAKGDLVVGTGADTFDKLTVGANDTVLTADSSTATGLKWAAPAGGGGYTLLASGSLSGTDVTVNVTTTGYKELVIYVKDVTATADYYPGLRPNADTGSNYTLVYQYMSSSTAVTNDVYASTTAFFLNQLEATNGDSFQRWTIYDPANTTTHKLADFSIGGRDLANTFNTVMGGRGVWRDNSAITSVNMYPSGASFSTGTYEIYGVK